MLRMVAMAQRNHHKIRLSKAARPVNGTFRYFTIGDAVTDIKSLYVLGLSTPERAIMFTDDLLKGKRILITGGGTGIGRAMAERFLQLGATVFICGRRREVVEKTAAELSASTDGTIEGFPCDVRYPEDVETLIEQLWAKGPLDVLVNNAAGNFLARTEELSAHAFDAVIGIVLKGTINMTMSCGRRWLATQHKAVVLSIATTYADTGSAYVVPSAEFALSPSLLERFAPKARSRGCCRRRSWRKSC